MSTYSDELRSQASRILTEHGDLRHEWRQDELVFPSSDPDGFEVALQAKSDGIGVLTDVGFHDRVDGPAVEAVRDALGLVRDLLSPDMRVRELCAGGHGYRWILERREAEGWSQEAQTALLFWNWLAGRSERIYQNRQLPGRLAPRPSRLPEQQ